MFLINGELFTLDEMLDHNPELADWLMSARPGDVFDDFNSEHVECV